MLGLLDSSSQRDMCVRVRACACVRVSVLSLCSQSDTPVLCCGAHPSVSNAGAYHCAVARPWHICSTARMSNAWVNGITYTRIRMSGTGAAKGNQYWTGKGARCQLTGRPAAVLCWFAQRCAHALRFGMHTCSVCGRCSRRACMTIFRVYACAVV